MVDTTAATVVRAQALSSLVTNADISYTLATPQRFVGRYACPVNASNIGSCSGIAGQRVTMVTCSSGGCGSMVGNVPPCVLAYSENFNRPAGAFYRVYSERIGTPSTTGVTTIASAPL